MKASPFGMKVPEGGSNCTKCMYYDPDAETTNGRCKNGQFIKWQTSQGKTDDADQIPEKPTAYCCNAFDWEGSGDE